MRKVVLAAIVVATIVVAVVLRPGSTFLAQTECDSWFERCRDDARWEHTQCLTRCSKLSPLLETGCRRSCGPQLEAALAACTCPAGTACQLDLTAPGTPMCCAPGEFACGGQCRPACDPGKRIDVGACACVCAPTTCPAPQVLDPVTCRCRCPGSCPATFIQDPATCTCSCREPLVDCDGVCRDLDIDPRHCGACGNVCDASEDCCSGTCTDVDEPAMCGYCGAKPCGNALVGTTPGPGKPPPPPTQDCCPAPKNSPFGGRYACVDTAKDPANCGSCGRACGQGQCCRKGTCVRPNTVTDCGVCGVACIPGVHDACCDGECTLLAKDRQNCGTCGRVCGPNQACTGGTCVTCAAGQSPCPDGCRDVASDPASCGPTCTTCSPGQSCCGGVCRSPQPGFACCGGVWTDTRSSAANCGSCGNSCGGQVCCNGTCAASCTPCGSGGQPGQICCGTSWRTPQAGWSCCGGAWTDLMSSAQSCGACGASCRAGQVCHGGSCVVPCGSGRYCAASTPACPIINLPSYEETTCCAIGSQSCEASFGPQYGRQCCPAGWRCCEAQNPMGIWIPYCSPYQSCDLTGARAPIPGTSTIH